ncbi:G-patch domain-containing protein, partial [Globomyces pollinis-pini]
AAQPKMGDVVGAKAIPISENNFGHRMLLKMGWTPGQSLGASNDGIVQPIQAVIRSKRGGLG